VPNPSQRQQRGDLVGLISGFVFALGLGLGGMTQPQKVIGFLDVFGNWDPSLAFVMAGAVGVYALAHRFVKPSNRPPSAPTARNTGKGSAVNIDRRLVLGAGLFGVGWGLVGYCPGPAVTSLASGAKIPIVFTVTMLVGMRSFDSLDQWLARRREIPRAIAQVVTPDEVHSVANETST